MPRLEAIHTNLLDRLRAAKEQGWLGEVAAIETSLAAAAQKLEAMRGLATRSVTVNLGMRRYATYPQQAMAPSDVTGRYLLRENYPIDIAAADDRLTLTAPDQPPAVLRHLPNGRYRLPGLDLEIRFRRTGDQTYTMELRQENLTQTATRHR